MASTHSTIENAVEEYKQIIQRMDALLKQADQEKANAVPDRVTALNDRIEDIGVIRQQLVAKVKQSGITREVLGETRRLMSIF